MLHKVAGWVSACTVFFFVAPPVCIDEVTFRDTLSEIVDHDRRRFSEQPIATASEIVDHEPGAPSMSAAMGVAFLVLLSCCMLSRAINSTQRALIAALIARQSFDVLLLLSVWLPAPFSSFLQLIAAVIAFSSGVSAASQHLRFVPRRWTEACWAWLLCATGISLGVQAFWAEDDTNIEHIGPEGVVVVVAGAVVHAIPSRALVVQWPQGLLTFFRSCSHRGIRHLIRLSRAWMRKLSKGIYRLYRASKKADKHEAFAGRRHTALRDTTPRGTLSHSSGRGLSRRTGEVSPLRPAICEPHGRYAWSKVVGRFFRKMSGSAGLHWRSGGTALYEKIRVAGNSLASLRSFLMARNTVGSVSASLRAHRGSERRDTHQHSASPPSTRKLSGDWNEHLPRCRDQSLPSHVEVGQRPSSHQRPSSSWIKEKGQVVQIATASVPVIAARRQQSATMQHRTESASDGRRSQNSSEVLKVCSLSNSRKERARSDLEKEQSCGERYKENVPCELTRQRQSSEKEIKPNLLLPKRKVSDAPRQSPPLRELGCNSGGGGSMSTSSATRQNDPVSSMSFFVDEEFTHDDAHDEVVPDQVRRPVDSSLCRHDERNVSCATASPGAFTEILGAHRSTVHTLAQRLDAIRIFKRHLAAGNEQAAISAISCCRDCWSQEDMNRFHSVLRKAREGLTAMASTT